MPAIFRVAAFALIAFLAWPFAMALIAAPAYMLADIGPAALAWAGLACSCVMAVPASRVAVSL